MFIMYQQRIVIVIVVIIMCIVYRLTVRTVRRDTLNSPYVFGDILNNQEAFLFMYCAVG